MGNLTATAHNATNGTNMGSQNVPPFRAAQKMSEIEAQLAVFGIMGIVSVIFNILTLIVIQKKFKTIPHLLLQNIIVVDLLTPLLNGPFFVLGLLFHTLGERAPIACNIQGFFHATLSTVFVNSVSLIALSRCLATLRPAVYHMIFVNKINVRILLLALWSTSALICVPPMNGWGAYRRYEGTCWLAWLPGEGSYMAYNVIMKSLPLYAAVLSCIVGLKVVRKANKVGVTNHKPKTPDANGRTPDASPTTTRINTDIFYIASTQLMVYIVLWVPLTVMNWLFLKDWRIVDFKVIIGFLFLFFARSLYNPVIMLVISSQIGKQFVKTLFLCKWAGNNNVERVIEL